MGFYLQDDYANTDTSQGRQTQNIVNTRTGASTPYNNSWNLEANSNPGGLGTLKIGTNNVGASGSVGGLNLAGGTNWQGGNATTEDYTNMFGIDSTREVWHPITATNPNGPEYLGMNQVNDAGQARVDQANSFLGGDFGAGLKGFSNLAGGLSSLAGIFTGFETLGIMKDQLSIAKDQWRETKIEMARIKGVRNKLNASYMA